MRGLRTSAACGLGLLLAIGAAPARAADAPSLGACPAGKQVEAGELQREGPVAFPQGFSPLVTSDRTRMAVLSLSGDTICIDGSSIEQIVVMSLSSGQEFLEFSWQGYEAYGYMFVDRRGKGQAVETGTMPIFSASLRLFASVDQTESEFGSLSGLAVWRVDPDGITPVAQVTDIERMQDWRIDDWVGETCIKLSAVPFDTVVDSPQALAEVPRVRFTAQASKEGSWAVSRQSCPAG